MIEIKDKRNCCGCSACSQICPKHCITMQEDEEGFKYPHVDASLCVNCGLCEKVCPYLNSYPIPKEKPASFACKTQDDDLREKSSSGGLFSILASRIIQEGGVVFGARFDAEWNVVNGYVETEEGLADFRGSKYSQSNMDDCFTQAKEFLKAGRKVLFSGTPCQVTGFNHFLQKKYDNLYTVDFVCHCVPSPKVWRNYLKEVRGIDKIVSLTFKDKSEGWAKYGLMIKGEKGLLAKGNHQKNIYMRAFLSNLIVRPGCTNCPARHYKSGADITMADCWGFGEYHPDLNDDKGMSLALLHTEKGVTLYKAIEPHLSSLQIPYEEVQEESNHKPIIASPRYHYYRDEFFREFIKGNNSTIGLMEKYIKKGDNRKHRIKVIKAITRVLPGFKLMRKMKR